MESENKQQNVQMNTFSGGMNADVAYSVLKPNQYPFAQDFRFVQNADSRTGELSSIQGLQIIDKFNDNTQHIFETYKIDRYGIFFVMTTDVHRTKIQDICIYRIDLPDLGGNVDSESLKLIFGPCKDWNIYNTPQEVTNNINRLSIVGRKENEDNIKLYIADGKHQLIIIDVLYDGDNPPSKLKDVLTNSPIPLMPPVIEDITTGQLKAGRNSYCYQFYSKYKQQTALSPLSKQINIVNRYNNSYGEKRIFVGDGQNEITNTGVKFKILIPTDSNYDILRIYRVHYVENGQQPEVDIIYDDVVDINKIKKEGCDRYLYYTDVSNNSLNRISLDQLQSKTGLYIIPKCICSKDDYLFAAQIKEYKHSSEQFDDINTTSLSFDKDGNTYLLNVGEEKDNKYKISYTDLSKDNWKKFDELTNSKDCVNPDQQSVPSTYRNSLSDSLYYTYKKGDETKLYYGGVGKHIDWRFVVTVLSADCCRKSNDEDGSNSAQIINGTTYDGERNHLFKYYVTYDGTLERQGGVLDTTIDQNLTYANPLIASKYISLRRGEVYRYGIIFYDKDGKASPVKWIADIRVPSININGFQSFSNNSDELDLSVMPIGVEFTLHDLEDRGIYSYEIVRCNRSVNDISIISQGVISRPVARHKQSQTSYDKVVYTPSGFIQSNRFNIRPYAEITAGGVYNPNYRIDNFENTTLFQFISPEFSYLSKSTLDMMKGLDIKLQPIKYLFSQPLRTIPENSKINKESLNATNFVLSKQNDSKISPLDFSDYSSLFEDIEETDVDSPNTKDYNFYLNSRLYNDMININYAYNAFGVNNINVTNTQNGQLESPTEYIVNSVKNPGFSYATGNISTAIKNRFQYFKLYCQSDDVTVLEQNEDDVYAMWHVDKDGKKRGNDVFFRSINDTTNIVNYKFVEGPKWDDLANVKDGKASKKFSDKINVIGNKSFCNFVCYKNYSEDNIGSIKDGGETYFINSAPYCLGGSSLLIQIDDKYTTDKDNHKSHLLSETVGVRGYTRIIKNNKNGYSVDNRTSFGAAGPHTIDENYAYISVVDPRYDHTEYPIFNKSRFGTFLCNIVRDVIPYGGYDKVSKDNSVYYSYADIKKFANNDKITVFNGDTYIGPFEYTSAHKTELKVIEQLPTFNVQYAIPVESSINMYIDHGFTFSKNPQQYNITWIQEQPADVNGVYQQGEPQYLYNAVYSAFNKSFDKTSKIHYLNKKDDTFDYRCRYSDKKENGEIQDSWQNFQPANYLDVDPDYGKITCLSIFKNSLVFFQQNAFGVFSVNERTAITDDNSKQLILGSGGVLSRYDYVSNNNGMADNMFSYTTTDTALYWLDLNRKELCSYSGGNSYSVLSKLKGVQSLIDLNIYSKVAYDEAYDEVIFGMVQRSISYNEQMSQFYSLYSVPIYTDCISWDNRLIIPANNIYGEWNKKHMLKRDDTEYFNPKLKIVVNNDFHRVKVFDNALLGANKYFVNSINLYCNTFNLSSNYINKNSISNRYYDYRFAIPRYNTDGNQLYGQRMRGKYLEYDIRNNVNTFNSTYERITIQYITTKYRTLWS